MIGPGLLDKTIAIFRRDLLTSIRYRSAFALTAGGTMLELAAFYYLAKAIGPGFRPAGFDYFSYLVVGTGFYTFLMMGIHAFLQSVQEAQQNGTFEVLVTTSTPGPVLVFLSAISAFSQNIVQLLFYLGAGLLFFTQPLPRINLIATLLIFCLSFVVAAAIGMIAAALQVTMQKGSVVVWSLGSGAWLLTGTLFPVANLPGPLRSFAECIPITHVLDAMRSALLQGAGVVALRQQLGIVAAFSGVLLSLGLLMFAYSLRCARQEGTLSSY
jgi:ABC-2 type transport system permease protein